MKQKNFLILFLLFLNISSFSQVNEEINRTDKEGRKQGHWIKRYPGGHVQYNAYFKDNQPFGSFYRYYENDTLHSLLIFSNEGREATAAIYHPNGYIASRGRFVNQLKEGNWQFFSDKLNGYLLHEEEYEGNKRNGISVKYYPGKTLLEKMFFKNDIKNGEWTQYFQNGNICLRGTYINGKLNGNFGVFFENGKPEYTGSYKEDTRQGTWLRYNIDGTLKDSINYKAGVAQNPEKFKKETEYLNSLEKNKGKIADPEKTGTIWK